MRFVISEPVHFEEATPRGLLVFDFPAGEIEPEDDSDERYVIEHKLVIDGLAERVDAPPVRPAPDSATADLPPAPDAEPEVPADDAPGA